MGCRYSSPASRPQVKMTTEKVKVLKVIGEKVGQLVAESKTPLNALKIDRVCAELREITDHLFPGKVVKQGVIHKQIFYVNPNHTLKCSFEDTPFMLTFEIPGLVPTPMTEVQNHVLDISPSFTLQPQIETPDASILNLKIVAHIKVVAAVWTQLEVVTQVEIFPRQN